jgi:Ca2+:H+ antiporter
MLLVLGCAFAAGGLKYKTQTFSKMGVSINAALLLLAVTSLSVPSVIHASHTELHGKDLREHSGNTQGTIVLI